MSFNSKMMFNFRKMSLNQIALVISVILITIYLVNLSREKYKSIEDIELSKLSNGNKVTQEELDTVLKFIR